MTHQTSMQHSAPILIMHLDGNIRKMLVEVFELEGYSTQGVGSGEVALRLLQAAEGGMIVYLEPFFLQVVGNE